MALLDRIFRLVKKKRRPPLIVAMLHASSKDPNYEIYTQCYGLEMQINDEWNAQLVLLAPFANFSAVVDKTSVTGADTAIVSAGVIDLPSKFGGGFNTSVVERDKDNWVLIGDPRSENDDPKLSEKLNAALKAGCRLIVCLRDLRTESIVKRLSTLKQIDGTRVVFVIATLDAMKPTIAKQAAKSIRKQVGNKCSIVVAGKATPVNVKRVLDIDGIDGVFLTDRHYGDFTDLLKLLKAVSR